MRELVRTNDAVLISAIEALLKGARIKHMVVDQNMSVLEGSIGIFPRRILVADGKMGPITTALHKAFFDIVNGLAPDTHNWLTPVKVREAVGV